MMPFLTEARESLELRTYVIGLRYTQQQVIMLHSLERLTNLAYRVILLIVVAACSLPAAASDRSLIIETERTSVRVVTLSSSLVHPWSIAFLPDEKMLVTQRPGRLVRVDPQGGMISISGVPEVLGQGQGGLLDLVIAPDFEVSRQIYFSYAEPRDGGNGTTVARARLEEARISNVEVIFRQLPSVDGTAHFGSRLVFAPDGSLFVTLGERQAKQFTIRAQDLETHFGKVVRLDRGGRAPSDNPFVAVPGARPEIWSYGHRNVQGAAIHPLTGELWITEHGPKGGDELNISRRGANYGWPLVTYGIAYNGDRIGMGQERLGIENPIKYWVPSIGTSGLAFYTADRIPQWKGNLFIGGLYGFLIRLELDGNRIVHEEPLLREIKGRIRDVREGPDGCIYVLTDSPEGRLLRIEPVDR